MKAITINRSEILGPFITPPECGGKMVSYSYACCEDWILVRMDDRSDLSSSVTAYRWPSRPGRNYTFEPQNRAPKLGRRVGEVTILEADSD